MQFSHIAVEGPIGVGKTSVVERLSQRLDALAVLEDWSHNPFLRDFYDGKPGAAFQTELFYLLSRYRQQQDLRQRDLFRQVTLSDYVFEKSRLFSYLNLDDNELLIYDKLYALLAEELRPPDLVVYLQARPEVLVERVKRRGAAFERGITDEYLTLLAEGYSRFFYHYTAAPVLIVNSENLNFVERDADLDLLVGKMRGMRSRREYFNLA